MRLATVRADGRTRAVRVEQDRHVDLGVPDVGALLALPDWQERAAQDGETATAEGADLAPVVPRPGKVVCVGLNYAQHIREMGRELPEFPTLFAKFPEALVARTTASSCRRSRTPSTGRPSSPSSSDGACGGRASRTRWPPLPASPCSTT